MDGMNWKHADGVQGLMTQRVEEPTLADRIAQGSLSVEEALPALGQVAGALDAVYE